MKFDVYPKIFETHKKEILNIKLLYEKETSNEYFVEIYGMDTGEKRILVLKPKNGILSAELELKEEQEYRVIIKSKENNGINEVFSIYACDKDLFYKNPYKGDLHMHTNRSDGQECPEYVALNMRKMGFDFIAITDHRNYSASLEAIESFKDIKSDFLILPGEEVHPPDNYVHIINFGGRESINEKMKDEKTYRKEVEEIMKNLKDFPEYLDKYIYASCVWCFEKIREAEGLSIFCHPFWITENAYNVPLNMIDYMFENKPFCAFELLGGHETESNNLQTAYYNNSREKQQKVPIAGVSDAHGIHNSYAGWFYTVVFSETLTFDDLKRNIKNFYSVAVESIPNEGTRIYGDFRLVKFTGFLLREYFPVHDNECFIEGSIIESKKAGQTADFETEFLEGLFNKYYNRNQGGKI